MYSGRIVIDSIGIDLSAAAVDAAGKCHYDEQKFQEDRIADVILEQVHRLKDMSGDVSVECVERGCVHNRRNPWMEDGEVDAESEKEMISHQTDFIIDGQLVEIRYQLEIFDQRDMMGGAAIEECVQ